MTSNNLTGISSDRIINSSRYQFRFLQCLICQDILWKPVACQSCEKPFCSSCIHQWLSNNPNRCPNRCEKYTERKCLGVILDMLSELKVSCFYKPNGCTEILSYEALDTHEMDCHYQLRQCSGCQEQILKKDFDEHINNCVLIDLTCQDCQLVYKRSETLTQHTENICLKRQLRKVMEELAKQKTKIIELESQLRNRGHLSSSPNSIPISFDDLPAANIQYFPISNVYRNLIWNRIAYVHEEYVTKKLPTSGYMNCFTNNNSSHVAYFFSHASIIAENLNKPFTFISITACAAWWDNLQLTITGQGRSERKYEHTEELKFGKPQIILLNWKDIDTIFFKTSNGVQHPGAEGGSGEYVVLTQITIDQWD